MATKKKYDQNVGKGGERSVLCLEIPSFASCSGIRFPSSLLFPFWGIFCFKCINSIGKNVCRKCHQLKATAQKKTDEKIK